MTATVESPPAPAGVHYPSYSLARAHFKELLDAAVHEQPATARRRDGRPVAFVDLERLRDFLAKMRPPQAGVIYEDGAWVMVLEGLGLAAEGLTLDDVAAEMVVVLREYAEDWLARLRHAINHRDNWGLVQLICLSTDEQLIEWLGSDKW